MKTIAVFAALFVVALAAPQRGSVKHSPVAVLLVREVPSNNIGLGAYNYGYELDDGQSRQETAEVDEVKVGENGEPAVALRITGSYSWVNPEDGQTYTVTYVADKNGFQPQGAHLPVAPVA